MKQGNAGTIIVIETCEFLIQGVKWILVLKSVKKIRSPRENDHNNCFKRCKNTWQIQKSVKAGWLGKNKGDYY